MILIATDKFKGTFSAAEAARIIGTAMAEAGVIGEIREMPMADGGEGTAECLGSLLGMKRTMAVARNSMGQEIMTSYYVDAAGRRAAVDAASVLSLTLVDESSRDIMRASSHPLGVLLRRIIDTHRPDEIFLGVGGTSTSDGGSGMMQALGMRFFDSEGRLIDTPMSPSLLTEVAVVDRSAMIPLPVIRPLCDVDVPLLDCCGGPSALTFAPQKGMTPEQEPELSIALRHWAELCGIKTVDASVTGGPFSGAGGGLISALDAAPRLGAEAIIRLAGIGEMPLTMIVTGEGSVDGQSMLGKVTGGLSQLGRQLGVPVIAIGGRVIRSEIPDGVFTALYSSLDYPGATPLQRLKATAVTAAKEIVAKLVKKR